MIPGRWRFVTLVLFSSTPISVLSPSFLPPLSVEGHSRQAERASERSHWLRIPRREPPGAGEPCDDHRGVAASLDSPLQLRVPGIVSEFANQKLSAGLTALGTVPGQTRNHVLVPGQAVGGHGPFGGRTKSVRGQCEQGPV